MAVLERGGNAFDAAAATAFTLQVAEPHLNGPGGDAPIIIHDAKSGRQQVICGQGPSPAAATLAHFEQLGLDLIPGTGLLPAIVPGAFGAWCVLLRDWGTWELADILAFAIGYAQNGVPLVPRVPATIESVRPLFESEWPTSAAVFLPYGQVPALDKPFANPALAATYERVLAEAIGATREARIEAARAAWYQGFVAEAVGTFFAQSDILDASGRRHRGLLAADDLARWSPTLEDPARFDYHGHTVLKCGPWSQGPALLQQLALLQGFDIAAMDPLGPDFIHTVAECMKLAFADREAYYGDPAFTPVPLETLLSPAYNDRRRALVGPEASLELRPGAVDNHAIPWVDHARPAPARRSSPEPPVPGSLPSPASASSAPTPSTSTPSTAGATWSAPPPPVAGCNPPPSSPASASPWAPVARCSGYAPAFPTALRPEQAPPHHPQPQLRPA